MSDFFLYIFAKKIMRIKLIILFICCSSLLFSQIIEGGDIGIVSITPNKTSKELIKKVINNYKNNIPEKQDFYQYNSYIKFLITTNRDSILNDRLYIPKKSKEKKQKKGNDIEMLDILNKGHIFIGERAMQHFYSNEKGYKNIVKANRVAGLKSPLYEFAAMDIQSLNLKDPYFVFLGRKYNNPISKSGLNKYRYYIIDTIDYKGLETIKVKFRPIGDSVKKHLRGHVWIDKNTRGIVKFNVNEASSKKENQIISEYHLKEGSWFPLKQSFEINTGKYDYVAETLEKNKQGVTVLDTFSKSQPIMVYGNTYFSDLEINTPIDKKTFRGHESEIDSKAFNLTQKEWKSYRQGIELNEIEKKTYLNLDSIGEKIKADRTLTFGRAVLSGMYPIKMIDLDLTSIINYNDYEGFRLGSAFKTNHLFDDRWQLEANLAYGFEDHNWKYGVGTSYLLNKPNYGIIGIHYSDDISPFGAQQFTMKSPYRDFRENLDRFHNDLYTKEKKFNLYFQQDFLNTAIFKFNISRNQREAAFNYTYNNENTFDFFNLELAVKWSPKSKFARTDFGKVTLENNFPTFQLNTTKGINGLGGDYDYTKFDIKLQHEIENPLGKTNILINSGIVFGDTPLTNLYAGNGNSSLRNGVFKNFNLAGTTSFETMGEGEFFSDRFSSIHINHYLPTFKILKKPIQTSLIYRGLIGDLNHKEDHSIEFNTLENYYQEAGFEVDNLFFIFGLGSYYRFGAYHLNNEGENFSVKLTAKIQLF